MNIFSTAPPPPDGRTMTDIHEFVAALRDHSTDPLAIRALAVHAMRVPIKSGALHLPENDVISCYGGCTFPPGDVATLIAMMADRPEAIQFIADMMEG